MSHAGGDHYNAEDELTQIVRLMGRSEGIASSWLSALRQMPKAYKIGAVLDLMRQVNQTELHLNRLLTALVQEETPQGAQTTDGVSPVDRESLEQVARAANIPLTEIGKGNTLGNIERDFADESGAMGTDGGLSF